MNERPAHAGRWPGWDGWFVLGSSAVLSGFALFRGVEDFGGPLLLAVSASLLYVVLTRSLRAWTRPDSPPMAGVRVLTVLPTHNNPASLRELVRTCLTHGPVLVIDDGSAIPAERLLEGLDVPVVRHAVNRGKGAALETALDHAGAHGFSHIVAIDADGQHEPEDLPAFFAAVRRDPDALIAGVRDMDAAPKTARYARANSNFWVWAETGMRLGDTQCGFRAYPVEPIRQLKLVPSRYQWEVEVLVRSVWAGIPVIDLPCQVYYPPPGERVSSYRKVVDTLRISWLNATLLAERALWPPRWFSARASWRGTHRGFLLGWQLYLEVLNLLGRRVVKLALVPLVTFYWLFLGAQQVGPDAYLSRRFPEDTPWRRARRRLQLLLNFASSLVDRFWVLQHGSEGLNVDHSRVEGVAERLEAHAGKGLIIVSSHSGNPDLAGMLMPVMRGLPVNLLLHGSPDDPYLALLRQFPNAPNLLFLNGEGSPASLAALRALNAGEIVALKADRVVDDRFATTTLLGDPIDLPTGPFLLAALSKAPVLFVGCFQTGPDTWTLEADGPHTFTFQRRSQRDADLQRWVEQWAALLDQWAQRYPLQWYHFFDPWSHHAPGRQPSEQQRR